MTRRTALLLLLASAGTASSFSPASHPARPAARATPAARLLGAMERLHDPAARGPAAERVYSLRDIDRITREIAEDEWTALGSAIAESMYETILDVGDGALRRRGWVDRMSLTNGIAEDVASAVEASLRKIRSQPTNAFEQGPHSLPEELLTSLHALLRRELGTIAGLRDESSSFDYNGRKLSLIVLSSVSDAIESYCGITNIDAPFFNLVNEMEHRIRFRRRELLVKHSKGYESVSNVKEDIEKGREDWVREVLGNRAARNYEHGEVTTKAGNGHSHEKERRARRGRQFQILNALFQDLDGVLMP